MMISILGIDIGKNNCSVVGVDDRGGDSPSNDAAADVDRVCQQHADLRHSDGSVLRRSPSWANFHVTRT